MLLVATLSKTCAVEVSSDSDLNREGLSDTDTEEPPPWTTSIERYARSLSSKKTSRGNVEIR